MDKQKLKNAVFVLLVVAILAVGFTFTVGPNAADYRAAFLELMTQEGNPFRFVFEPLVQRPEEEGGEELPKTDDLAPGETPVLPFESPTFDPEPEDNPPIGNGEQQSGGSQPQDTLPSDVLNP